MEIASAFKAKGCAVEIRDLGASYRSGGEIFIFSPGLSPESKGGFKFDLADFCGFDGTGYDGRGRRYYVWIVTAGEMVPATQAEYQNAVEGKRIAFGNESKSCGNEQWFVDRLEKATSGLSDFGSAFAALGL